MFFTVVLCSILLASVLVKANVQNVFDQDLYEKVLDSEQCVEQLEYLSRNTAGLLFLDASAKPPSSISQLNLIDYGDYLLCLSLNHEMAEDQNIEGKFCMVEVPLAQNTVNSLSKLAGRNWLQPAWPSNDTLAVYSQYERSRRQLETVTGFKERYSSSNNNVFGLTLKLGLCVPKVCSATQAINHFVDKVPLLQIDFNEAYCRLPGDKPFATPDIVATVVFSVIGLAAILSTSFDLYHTFYLKSRSKSPILTSFSMYTNTKRFLTFNKVPGAIECMDGIRAISMLWIVVGHSFSSTLIGAVHNSLYAYEFVTKFSSVWLNAAPISVDTFLLLSGILCVYTTVGKLNQSTFVKAIPMFYLQRFLRMFPILAVMVLYTSSFIFHSSDGPEWQGIALITHNCRTNWWVAFVFLQNYVQKSTMCMGHSWYLSVDFQLYIISPLVIFWLFGRRTFAWSALTFTLLLSLAGSSAYSFYYNYSSAIFGQTPENSARYMSEFYINTLCRASPFCIGLLYGYVLHLLRDKKLRITRMQSLMLWVLSFGMMAFCIFTMYPVVQPDFDNQFLDNFLNAYMRTIWAVAVGWLILACDKGYGGPINWLLSLQVWKLPARLSYAMYLIHYMLIYVANKSWMKPHYFGTAETIYRFFGDASLTMLIALAVCIVVDAPCTTLQKMLLGNPKKQSQKPEPGTNISTGMEYENMTKDRL